MGSTVMKLVMLICSYNTYLIFTSKVIFETNFSVLYNALRKFFITRKLVQIN